MLDKLNEKLADGAAVLGPIRSDLDDLEIEVQKYCATIQVSVPLASLPRCTFKDMSQTCVYAVSSNELSVVSGMIEDLQKVTERVAKVESGALSRNDDRQRATQKSEDAEEAYFKDVYGRPAGSAPADAASLPAMQSAMQAASNVLLLQQKQLVLKTLANSVRRRLDDLIASLNGAKAILEGDSETFRELNVQCSEWIVSLQSPSR